MKIKLYGMPLSNYYSMVKHALLAKGVDIEYVDQFPSKEPEFLSISPMGKVPVIETAEGFLTETSVIMDYLEETLPTPALLPQTPFARARVKQMMKVQELYIETPVHGLVGVIFGREVPEYLKEVCPAQARRGLGALGRLAVFGPFLCGEELTFADIFAYYSFTLSRRLTQEVYGWDLLEDVPGLTAWYDMMSEQDITRQVLADMQAAAAAV